MVANIIFDVLHRSVEASSVYVVVSAPMNKIVVAF